MKTGRMQRRIYGLLDMRFTNFLLDTHESRPLWPLSAFTTMQIETVVDLQENTLGLCREKCRTVRRSSAGVEVCVCVSLLLLLLVVVLPSWLRAKGDDGQGNRRESTGCLVRSRHHLIGVSLHSSTALPDPAKVEALKLLASFPSPDCFRGMVSV